MCLLSEASRSGVLAAVLTVLAVGGCAPDRPEPEPSPEPPPYYEAVPRDLCERFRPRQVAGFDLVVPDDYEPEVRNYEAPWWWSMHCVIRAEDGDGRFDTSIGDYPIHGLVSVDVYRDRDDAPERYQGSSGSFVRQHPEAVVDDIQGWWDEGIGAERVKPMPQDPRAKVFNFDYYLYHENLIMQLQLSGVAPNQRIDEALAVTRDLMDAAIEETNAHLTLVEPR